MRWINDSPQELVDDVRLRGRQQKQQRYAQRLERFHRLMQPIRDAQEQMRAEYPHHCGNCLAPLARPGHCDERCRVLGEMKAMSDKEDLWTQEN